MPPLFAAAIVVFLEIVCLGAIIPVLPDYTTALGGNAAWAGVMFALVTGPKVVMNQVWGRLSDRRGRKPTLALLTGGSILGSALWALTPTLAGLGGSGLFWLAVSRLVYGTFGSQAALANAIASDTSTPDKRSAAMGVLGAAFGIGLTVGFPLGGVIGSLSHEAVGWLCAGCEAIALLVILFALRETHQPANHQTDAFETQPMRGLMTMPAIVALAAAFVVMWTGMSVMTPTLRPLTELWYGFTLRQTSYAFLVWGVVSVIVQGGLIRPTVARLGEKRTYTLGTLITAGSFALIAAHPTLTWFWPAMVGMALGAGLASPALTGLISFQVGPRQQGAVHGLSQSATSVGRAAGYILGGAIFTHVTPPAAYYLGAVCLLLGLAPLASRTIRNSNI